ncbi:MAG: ABC transporter ATP-binding protein, partial [Anaerolineae bacterium]|nr:ABC transporter ATP-binding protein [Anaerolineae bacterium]
VQNMINALAAGQTANLPPLVKNVAQIAAAQQLGISVSDLTALAADAENALISAALLIVVFAVTRGVFSFIQSYMAEKTSQGIAFDLRNELFSKIQRLSFSYHDRNQTGQLMIRATDDVEKVRLFLAQGLVLAVGAFLLLIATLIILLATNWQLTLVILPILPIALVLFMGFGAIAQPLFGEFQKRLSTLTTILQESVAGIKVIKAFTREPQQSERFDAATVDLFRQGLKIGRTFSFLFPFIFLIAQIGQAVLLYYGGQQIVNGQTSLGVYQEFTLYLVYVFFPLGQLGFIISLMAQASASAGRIFEVLDAKSDVTDKPDAVSMETIQGQVEFKNVTFRYFSSGEPVLNNVSFEAQPGQAIALLGATGSGKTTIINLIPRFYDASEGQILIDGVDIRDVTLDSLREQIGIVLQETNLFSGTIRENIAFGRPEATLDQVMDAAKAAAAHDFIMSFPQGYDTSVGERGSTLSGGQKQRIAIARALLLDPHILILDDSTSSVDLQTEAQIQSALDHLMEGRTSFVIAQRISTVVNADQILVLDKGQIAARGKHTELMETSPIYAEIYHSQLVDDAEKAPVGAV